MLRPPVRVNFVCSGNICRSPTAEAVLVTLARDAELADLVRITSSGTGSWHAGDDMDVRSRQTLEAAGYQPPRHVAKQFQPADFADSDLVVALDTGHHNILWRLAAETDDADAARAKTVLLRSFDPERAGADDLDVADPYYGGDGGFTDVLAQVERSCGGLLEAIRSAVESGTAVQAPQQTDKPPL